MSLKGPLRRTVLPTMRFSVESSTTMPSPKSGPDPVRLGRTPQAISWAKRMERGLVRISTVTRLEVGYSARTSAALREGLRQPPMSAMPVEYLTPAIEDRAMEVQTLLADRGNHRGPGVGDLLIAATAESAGLVALHLDKDLDTIAEITGQPLERLAG